MKKEDFNNNYKDASEKEILTETLYTQKLILKKLEANRKNTSNLVWIITLSIAVLIIFGFVNYLSLLTAM